MDYFWKKFIDWLDLFKTLVVDEKFSFGKTMENMRKYRDVELVTTEGRRNYLVSEPSYHTTKFSQKICLL